MRTGEEKKLAIVMYHYVRDLTYSRYPEIKGLDVRLFEKQLEYIRKSFRVIRMEELIAAFDSQDFSRLPDNACLLTFDDGYIDHYTAVYPLLKKYGMQGSFFPNARAVKEHRLLDVNKIHYILAAAPIGELVAGIFDLLTEYRKEGRFADGEIPSNEELYRELAVPNRFDPGEVIFVKRLLQNRLPEKIRGEIATALFQTYVGVKEEVFARELYMNKEQIRCMKEGGMFFGLHGYDHYWLGKLPKEKMKEDILQAKAFFSDVIDPGCWVMNYPYGNYSEEVLEFIAGEETGCRLGLTVEARMAEPSRENRYLLPRWDTNDLPPKGNLCC